MQRQALKRAAELLGLESDELPLNAGYVDLLVGEGPMPTGAAQRLMGTSIVPSIYERWWRPALGRVAKGIRGPSTAGELGRVRQLLSLTPGDTVVDVACGPGNVTRACADDVGTTGTVVGIDVSRTMLARAVRATAAPQVVYVRGDITRMQLQPGSADAVCCVAALHLFSAPGRALDVMVQALADDGRLVILTSACPDRRVSAFTATAFGRLAGMRMFSPAALAEGLALRGLTVTYQRRFGLLQLLSGRRHPRPAVTPLA